MTATAENFTPVKIMQINEMPVEERTAIREAIRIVDHDGVTVVPAMWASAMAFGPKGQPSERNVREREAMQELKG